MPDLGLVLQLKEYWYIAAESSELRSKPIPRTVLGERLVLFRQSDGTPSALLDRCAHRNAPLSQGKIADNSLECPYHGWKYDEKGECTEIPSLNGEQTGISIRAYPTIEKDGFIWVYMGVKSPIDFPLKFPYLGEPNWCAFRMKTRFEASAFSCLENFLDCPHTVYVHQGWFRSKHVKEVRAFVKTNKDSVEVEFAEERDAESVVSKLLFPSKKKMAHTDKFMMPTTSRVDYSFSPDHHYIITSQCTPISEYETEVYTVITFRFWKIAPLIRLFFEPISRRIIRQDVEILKLHTEQLQHFGKADFKFVKSDLVGPHIWKLWQKALGQESASGNGKSKDFTHSDEQEVVLRF